MRSIKSDLNLESIPGQGRIRHPIIGEVIIWRQHEFHTWWNLFEPMMEHPLSRTFINAFVDSFEFNNVLPKSNGIFRKRKFNTELELRTSQLGWGKVLLKDQKVIHSAHPLLSVALGQYALETFTEQRYKVRWIEPRSQVVQLETEVSTQLPSPQPPSPIPWSGDNTPSAFESLSMEIETHENHELRYEGERVLLIPFTSMERFLTACMPYVPKDNEAWFNNQSDALSTHQDVLKIVIQSTSAMFLQSEQPVYIIDESSWNAYVNHYLIERGWGSVHLNDYDATTFDLEVVIPMSQQLPFTLGLMCGMWERAHGRSYQIKIHQEKDTFIAKIQSLLEYQNQ